MLNGAVTSLKIDLHDDAKLNGQVPNECLPEPPYSDDAKYEFGVQLCSGSNCTIHFNQQFDYTPLVFVMPTIATSSPDSDMPATLVITDVTNSSAQIQQVADSRWSYPNNIPMTEVSYLAIEPGRASFNGHEVIAGYTDTNAYKAKNFNGTSVTVNFSEFGKSDDFSTAPVVLHQIQSANNSSKWMTSGKTRTNSDTTSVTLFLELSNGRDRDHDYVSERIGFIATQPITNLEVDDSIVEFGRG
ncbi:MSHA biogenesis protein MshQ [Vibrio astriarenae]|nr:MSHA biogenesis protein MshQ [Vibrio sp. C7]